MNSAYECINTTRSFRHMETNCCRQLEKFKSHAYTHCRTKIGFFSAEQNLIFSIGTRITTKIELKKLHNSDFYGIPAIAEIITNQERPKSAPYLRLKKAKGLQFVKYSLLKYPREKIPIFFEFFWSP